MLTVTGVRRRAGAADQRAALSAARAGTWHWDRPTGLVRWDPMLEALCGLAPGGFGGTLEDWHRSIHPSDREDVLAVVRAAFERRGPYQVVHRVVWPDGTLRWLESRGAVTLGASGEPTGTAGCAFDVTDQRVAERHQAMVLDETEIAAERLHRLQRTSHALTVAMTMGDVVAVVMDALEAPRTATARALWLTNDLADSLVLAAQEGMKPEAAAMFREIERSGDLPGAVALRERRTVVSPSRADAVERFPDLQAAPRTAEGFIAVPLVVDHEALGVIAFGYEGALDGHDIPYLEAAGANIAQTLKRVRLAESLVRRSEDVAFLADITQAAITAIDHVNLMDRIVAAIVPRLGDLCTISFVPEPGASIHAVAATTRAARSAWSRELARGSSTEDYGAQAAASALRGGPPALIRSLTPEVIGALVGREVDAAWFLRLVDELDMTSVITVPFHTDGRVTGELRVFATEQHPRHDDQDLDLARSVAAGLGEALHSRWLTDQHRHISASLQQAFLPPTLPQVPNLDIASAYWPAGTANEVGGDFYDLFEIGDHCWAMLIGDACGTGPDAAATAAIARHTARAAARHGLGHREVLEWMNQAVKHSDRDLFCTACYITLDAPPDGCAIAVTVASAGHPLPILVSGDGAGPVGTPGTLLGVFDDPTFTITEATLGPQSTLVLYTDGLTNLPGRFGRTDGELSGLLTAHPATTSREVLALLRDDLDRRVSASRREDDTALLVIRNATPPGGPAGP